MGLRGLTNEGMGYDSKESGNVDWASEADGEEMLRKSVARG